MSSCNPISSFPQSRASHGAAVLYLLSVLQVVVNGNPFYEYEHRLPLQMVTHLQVDGDLELQSINFLGGQPAAAPYPVWNVSSFACVTHSHICHCVPTPSSFGIQW